MEITENARLRSISTWMGDRLGKQTKMLRVHARGVNAVSSTGKKSNPDNDPP
jgi:hypothetical protein